jgi:isocitrate dehydrogenase (NAD+)
MAEARRALAFLLKNELESGAVELREIRGLTIENRLKHGKTLPDESLEDIKGCDVMLKGPFTTPGGGTMQSANIALRGMFDLYANIRPVKVPSKGIDWTFFRENTEGEYILGSRGIATEGIAVDFRIITDAGTRRIARAAFDYARKNGKKTVTAITKANIVKRTDGRFSEICKEVARDYPEIHADEYYVDIMSANLINPEINHTFDVMVLPNLYGDILSDEGAQVQGSVGTAGSANIGDDFAIFEAIHGSAPRMINDGLADYANPTSILNATEMMLRHLGFTDKADRLLRAIDVSTADDCPVKVTGKADGATCREFGNYVMGVLMKKEESL